jgi:hypothetical protein
VGKNAIWHQTTYVTDGLYFTKYNQMHTLSIIVGVILVINGIGMHYRRLYFMETKVKIKMFIPV